MDTFTLSCFLLNPLDAKYLLTGLMKFFLFPPGTNSCLPCHGSCRECDTSSANCRSCRVGYSLVGNVCKKDIKDSGIESILVLVLVLFFSTFVISTILFLIYYARQNGYLCWANKKHYLQVPREDDKDGVVHLNYSDEVDE